MLDMFDDCPIPDIYKPPRALDDWVDDEEYIFS
jgi:hypothetical protein